MLCRERRCCRRKKIATAKPQPPPPPPTILAIPPPPPPPPFMPPASPGRWHKWWWHGGFLTFYFQTYTSYRQIEHCLQLSQQQIAILNCYFTENVLAFGYKGVQWYYRKVITIIIKIMCWVHMLWVHIPTDQAVWVQCNIGALQLRGYWSTIILVTDI